jgi:hypothetical protein
MLCNIGIIRCRTLISYATTVLYDILRLYRLKRTTKPYDVACDVVTYDVTYDIACLSFPVQWALATDTLGSQAVTQQSLAVPELYHT